MADITAITELARHLVGNDQALIAEIRLAIERPQDYVARFRERLSYRGIRAPNRDLPWYALLNGLIDRHHLVEVDWKAWPHDVIKAMTVLAGPEADWVWISDHPEWDVEDRTPDVVEEMFAAIQERLIQKNLSLVLLWLDGDGLPLMVLPNDRVIEARRLARLSGYDIQAADQSW